MKLPDVKGAGLEIEEQDGSQEAEIAKAGDKESLCRRPCRRRSVEPEADEEIRAKSHPLPEYIKEEEVIGQDQPQHARGEKRHEGEVAGITRVATHVTLGVDLNQKADRGDHNEHNRSQRIHGHP